MGRVSPVVRVAFIEGKYFLEVEGRSQHVPIETVSDATRLNRLVGQQVKAMYSAPSGAVVALVPENLQPVRCFIPWPTRTLGMAW
jgi:hypothetical protein